MPIRKKQEYTLYSKENTQHRDRLEVLFSVEVNFSKSEEDKHIFSNIFELYGVGLKSSPHRTKILTLFPISKKF